MNKIVEADATAAARRRLPTVEVDSVVILIGPHDPATHLDAFEGRMGDHLDIGPRIETQGGLR
jgi:predicted dithiol-disulfide oxidoreductase (DUF899 family)